MKKSHSGQEEFLVYIPPSLGYLAIKPKQLRRQHRAVVGLIDHDSMQFADTNKVLQNQNVHDRTTTPLELAKQKLKSMPRFGDESLGLHWRTRRGTSHARGALRDFRQAEQFLADSTEKVDYIRFQGSQTYASFSRSFRNPSNALSDLLGIILASAKCGLKQRKLLAEITEIQGIAELDLEKDSRSAILDRNRDLLLESNSSVFAAVEFSWGTLLLPTAGHEFGSLTTLGLDKQSVLPLSRLAELFTLMPEINGGWGPWLSFQESNSNGLLLKYPTAIEPNLEAILTCWRKQSNPPRRAATEAHCNHETPRRTPGHLPHAAENPHSAFEAPISHWSGIDEAVESTRQVALSWLGDDSPADLGAVDNVVNGILNHRASASSPITPIVSSSLSRVGVRNLERRQFGEQIIALLVLEREIDRQLCGESNPEIFAKSLSAYVASVNRNQVEPRAWAVMRTVRAITEWVGGVRIPSSFMLTIDAEHISSESWRKLLPHAPWIQWFAPRRLSGMQFKIGVQEYLEFLSLLRPQYNYTHGRVSGHTPGERVGVPKRWRALFTITEDQDISDEQLNFLADAMLESLRDPAHTARMLERQRLPDAVTVAVQSILANKVGVAQPTAFLGILDGSEHERRIIVANLDPLRSLQYRVGDDLQRLPPFAIDEMGAYSYCAAPRQFSMHESIKVRDTIIKPPQDAPPLAQSGNVVSAHIPIEMFRGRQEQLARLRKALTGSGPRPGSFIFGPRRAGKSTIANRMCQDDSTNGSLWLDLSNTPTNVRDFGQWQDSVTRQLRRRIARDLSGLAWQSDATDFIEVIEDLDTALDGAPPIVLVLDELDVLLLPEVSTAGRRTAGRLGNLVLRNVAMIGTVQRFHRSIQELKSWQSIECPADLGWADGITYFTPPLSINEGPVVTFMDRAGITPRVFEHAVYPKLGLRPYFWAQLRSRIEAQVSIASSEVRFCNSVDVDRHIAAMLEEDTHLSAILDSGEGYSAEERMRLDLFSPEELRILCTFAEDPQRRRSYTRNELQQGSTSEALDSLVDRGYLRWNDARSSASPAVGIFYDYIISRASDIRALSGSADCRDSRQ